jgi:hypothetical protein
VDGLGTGVIRSGWNVTLDKKEQEEVLRDILNEILPLSLLSINLIQRHAGISSPLKSFNDIVLRDSKEKVLMSDSILGSEFSREYKVILYKITEFICRVYSYDSKKYRD